MCLLITNLVSYPIRLAFAVCKLLGQYLQFLSKTGGKNVQLVRRSLRKGRGGEAWKNRTKYTDRRYSLHLSGL